MQKIKIIFFYVILPIDTNEMHVNDNEYKKNRADFSR